MSPYQLEVSETKVPRIMEAACALASLAKTSENDSLTASNPLVVSSPEETNNFLSKKRDMTKLKSLTFPREIYAKKERIKKFPEMLMDILSDRSCSDAIVWLPHGRSFVIKSPEILTKVILPFYVKGCKFSSFTRKLYRWGFRQISRGPDAESFYHKKFRRDLPEMCKDIVCTREVRDGCPELHEGIGVAEMKERLSKSKTNELSSGLLGRVRGIGIPKEVDAESFYHEKFRRDFSELRKDLRLARGLLDSHPNLHDSLCIAELKGGLLRSKTEEIPSLLLAELRSIVAQDHLKTPRMNFEYLQRGKLTRDDGIGSQHNAQDCRHGRRNDQGASSVRSSAPNRSYVGSSHQPLADFKGSLMSMAAKRSLASSPIWSEHLDQKRRCAYPNRHVSNSMALDRAHDKISCYTADVVKEALEVLHRDTF